MPSRRRQQRRSLAIAWMIVIVAVSLVGVARALHDLADLFKNTRTKPAHVSNRRDTVASDKGSLHNSLSSLPGPKIFEDGEGFADGESGATHRRFKRIADPEDSPAGARRSLRRPHHLTARRRSSRRMFRRFALDESNPADESESEYASAYDDDVDLPGAFLNDELTKKRNQLEDVYPEVSELPKPQHSPPDFLKKPVVNVDDTVRKKRDRDEEEEEEAECADEAHEEYYYEDEAPESRRGNSKRASQSAVEYIDEEKRNYKRNFDAISAVNRNHQNIDKHFKATGKERAAEEPLTSRKNIRSSVKLKSPSAVTKISAAKSSLNIVKRKVERKPKKEKKRPKPKSQPKPKPKPKAKSKRPKPRKKAKNIASVQSVKLNSDCCEEDAEGAMDVDRKKRGKTLVIKAIPKGKNVNELQIYQKADTTKKKAATKLTEKQSNVKDLTALSIGEVKDLLGELMIKIDSLHDLISELRNGGGEAHTDDLNEKLTRSNLPVGGSQVTPCRRRWVSWCARGAQNHSCSCLADCRQVSLQSDVSNASVVIPNAQPQSSSAFSSAALFLFLF